ncbi:MAG TPA: hypothetical protein DCS43_06580 [Verrucomicrobia bacterium]|nr:hypothetical protein [Verrucomicrobiota bacterium]
MHFTFRQYRILCVAALLAVYTGLNPSLSGALEPVVSSASDTNAMALASEALDAVNRRFDGLSTLQYEVQRTTVSRGVTLEEHWSFAYAADGRLRIEYKKPEKRIFVFDGKVFTEYLPAVRQALQTDIGDGNPHGFERMSAVLQRLSVDGLRIGNRDMLLSHFESAKRLDDQAAILKVTGKDPAYTLLIDTQRQTLLRFEKYDGKGTLTLSIRVSDFQEPMPGFWFPTALQTLAEGANGKSESTVAISAIRLNAVIPDKIFKATLPPDVKVNTAN